MHLIGSDEEAHHNDDLSLSYTKHQLEQCRDVGDKTPTINSSLPLIGLKTAFCDVNNIKKALYAVEVVIICLYKQLSLAHSESETHLDLDTWAGMHEGVMIKYWCSVMRFQMTTLMC